MEKKMTKKEMLMELKTLADDCGPEYAYLVDFCDAEIALLDKRAAKAKEKKAEKDNLLDAVAAVLVEDFVGIADIASKVDDPDATVAKVTYRLNQLVKEGKAQKQEITIPATEGAKARKVMGFAAL